MKFSFFPAEKNLCSLYGHVFVINDMNRVYKSNTSELFIGIFLHYITIFRNVDRIPTLCAETKCSDITK